MVCDTNVLVHGIAGPLSGYDWHATVSRHQSETITVVIPAMVIDELDSLKRSGKQETRSAARRALIQLDEHFASGNTSQPLRTVPGGGTARITAYLDDIEHVRLPSPDSEIIDRTLALQGRMPLPGPRRVRLLTGDTGMLLRARQAGIECVKLPTPAPETVAKKT